LIIRGAPGVGKSAVCGVLKKRLHHSAVIEVDVLRAMRSEVNWVDQESQKLGLEQASLLAESFIKAGAHPVLLVDTLLGDALDYLISNLNKPRKVFTFTADNTTLIKRARERENGYLDEKVILSMNRWFLASRSTHETAIDTSRLSVEEIAEIILRDMADVDVRDKE
jgi:broad-specificity NMP kinase